MGQIATKSNQHDYAKFKEKYIVKKKINDKKFGEAMLIENITTKSDFFLKEYIAHSSVEFKNLHDKISLSDNIKDPYIIEIIDYFTQRNMNCCSELYKLYVVFELCNKNLDSEIIDRTTQDQMRLFSNDDLIYLTESYITGLSSLQAHQKFHGNISLHSLLISKNGVYKVADQTLMNMPSNFDLMMLNQIETKGIYLSPEQIQLLNNKDLKISINNYKSDVFTLGICLLHAALLSPCDDLYDYNEMSFISENLKIKIEKMKENHSITLIKFLTEMTKENPQDRPDFLKLSERMNEILKMNKNEKRNQFSRKSSGEPIKIDKSNILKKNYRDNEIHSSLFTNQRKQRISSELESGKLKEFNGNFYIAKSIKGGEMHNIGSLESYEQIKEEIEDDEEQTKDFNTFPHLNDIENIEELCKQFGIEPPKPINKNRYKKKISGKNYQNQNISLRKPSEKSEMNPFSSIKKFSKSNKTENPYYLLSSDSFSNNRLSSLTPPKISSFLSDSFQTKKHITENFNNGSKYEGEKTDGMRSGFGKFIYPNGAYYEGEWKENKKNGKGVLVNYDGKTIYEGQWLNDKYHGKGTLFNQNIIFSLEDFEFEDFNFLNGKWLRYEGMFENDKKHGKGILVLINGEKFYGTFEEGFIQGQGVFYGKTGKVVSGMWKNNKFVGNS